MERQTLYLVHTNIKALTYFGICNIEGLFLYCMPSFLAITVVTRPTELIVTVS